MTLDDIDIQLGDIKSVDPLNARAGEPPDPDIPQLARSILASGGTVQPLVLRARNDGGFAVLIGRRRWLAMLALVEQAEPGWTLERSMPALLFKGADAEATSLELQEQINRVALTAPQEVVAFAQLALHGHGVDDIARDFGCSVKLVRQRLAMGALSPKILAAWSEGKITFACAQAYCTNPSHAAQDEFFDAHPDTRLYANNVRSALRGEKLSSETPIARFVGLPAYQAAGGAIESDLFDESAWLTSPAILERLAREKLHAEGERLKRAEGWGWAANRYDSAVPLHELAMASEADPEYRQAETARMDELSALLTHGENDEALAEFQALESKGWTRGVSAARRRKLGVWVDFDQDGAFDIERARELAPATADDTAEEVPDKSLANDASDDRPIAKPQKIAPAFEGQRLQLAMLASAATTAVRRLILTSLDFALLCGAACCFDRGDFDCDFGGIDGDSLQQDAPEVLRGMDDGGFYKVLPKLVAVIADDYPSLLFRHALAASFEAYNIHQAETILSAARRMRLPIDDELCAAFDYETWFATMDKADLDAFAKTLPKDVAATKKSLRVATFANHARTAGWLPDELRERKAEPRQIGAVAPEADDLEEALR